MDPVRTTLTYVVRGESAVFNAADRAASYWPKEPHEVEIADMRAIPGTLSFDRNGFVLAKGPSATTGLTDETEIKRIHAEEAKALVKALTGASMVIAFGPMIRTDASEAADGNLPAFGAHVDYGARTVRDFVMDQLDPAEAEERLAKRHMLINVWRPLREVERTPLALADASTVSRDDLFPSEIIGGLGDAKRRSLHGFNLAWNPAHRWYYAPHMQPDEAYVFRLFDSDSERVQFTGHTAFEDPTSAPGAAPRQSAEVRTIAFLD